MSLCKDCRHEEVIGDQRQRRVCLKLTPESAMTQTIDAKSGGWVICMNARAEGGECHNGKFWQPK